MTPAANPPLTPARASARVSGHVVVLDLEADRYYLQTTADDDPGFGPEAPQRVVWPKAGWRAGAGLSSLLCLRRVAHLLRRGPFRGMVEHVATTPVRRRRNPPPPAQLLASFEAFRPFFSQARICRLDAPALCIFFRRHGWDARLVFGARLEPFSAHCWAQLDDAVLNESQVTVRTYTPLLAV